MTTAAADISILLCAFVALLLPPLALLTPARPSYRFPSLDPLSRPQVALGTAKAAVAPAMVDSDAAVFPAENRQRPSLPWGAMAATLYAAGLVVTIAPLIAGLLSVRRLGARAGMASGERLSDESASACRRMGVRHCVSLRLSDQVAVPMTWGWRCSVILLPAEAVEWPPEQQQAALLHEAAHIARGDWAAQMIARLVCSLYWFHPLAWLAAARMRVEAERASDDRVLLAGVAAPDYAQHLLGIACALRSQHGFGQPIALAMAHTRDIENRLRAILDIHLDRRPLGNRTITLLLLGGTIFLAPLASLRPTIAQPPPLNPIEEKRRFVEAVLEHNRIRQQEQRYAEIEQRLVAMEQEIEALSLQQDAGSQDRRLLALRLQAAREAVALVRQKALLRNQAIYFGGKATSIQERLKDTQDREQRQRLARTLDFAKRLRDKATSDLASAEIQQQVLQQRASQLTTEEKYLQVTLRDTAIQIEATRKRLSGTKNTVTISALQQELRELEIARETQTVRYEYVENQLQ